MGFLAVLFGVVGAAAVSNVSITGDGIIGMTIASLIGGSITGGFAISDNKDEVKIGDTDGEGGDGMAQ